MLLNIFVCSVFWQHFRNKKILRVLFFQKRDLPLSNLTNIEISLNLFLSSVIFSVCFSLVPFYFASFFFSAFLCLLSTQKLKLFPLYALI